MADVLCCAVPQKARADEAGNTRTRHRKKEQNPPHLDNFLIVVEPPVELNESDRDGINAAVKHCLIQLTAKKEAIAPETRLQVFRKMLTALYLEERPRISANRARP